MCELDNGLSPIACKPVLPPDELKNNSFEDGRLFVHQNKLWISCTVSQWPSDQFRSVVAYGALVESESHWSIGPYYLPNYGRNAFTAVEKNFLFIPRGEQLWCIYRVIGHEQIIIQLEGSVVKEVLKSKALLWPKAEIHGGAICEGNNGNLLHFFNSHTSHKERHRDRYSIGCAELAGQPPFDMLRISKSPILSGEEGACLDKNVHYKSNVVFCCGAIKDGDSWLLSYGWNDCQARLVRLREADLKL